MVFLKARDVAIVEKNKPATNSRTVQQHECCDSEVIVHKQSHQPKRLQAGVLAEFEFDEVKIRAQDVGHEKNYKCDKGYKVTNGNGVQIGHAFDDIAVDEVPERSTEVEQVGHEHNRFTDYVVWFEHKGKNLEEKEGSTKFAGHAGIEYNDDDAYDNNKEHDDSYYPGSSIPARQAFFPPDKKKARKINLNIEWIKAENGIIRHYVSCGTFSCP